MGTLKINVCVVDHRALDRRALGYTALMRDLHRSIDPHWKMRSVFGAIQGMPGIPGNLIGALKPAPVSVFRVIPGLLVLVAVVETVEP